MDVESWVSDRTGGCVLRARQQQEDQYKHALRTTVHRIPQLAREAKNWKRERERHMCKERKSAEGAGGRQTL